MNQMKDQSSNNNNNSIRKALLTNLHSFTIATLTMTIALFVLYPTIILNSTHYWL